MSARPVEVALCRLPFDCGNVDGAVGLSCGANTSGVKAQPNLQARVVALHPGGWFRSDHAHRLDPSGRHPRPHRYQGRQARQHRGRRFGTRLEDLTMIMTTAFWKGATERALKTFLQTFIATAGVQIGIVLTGDAFVALPWLTAFVTAGTAALLSLATSIGNASFTAGDPDIVVYPGEYSDWDRMDGLGADGVPDDNPQRKA